ncbi:DUF2625 domain-containing protein [uncultured Pontibacter sp.]|uniref:DUF2625 domain-containing protein n=1 Tax=uncultured Pontibacter sp. TaxID=453356 RepID=UPI00260FEB8E|nr:DUF2625 domain-containing protein [uncultured Pontibacter sp.]
MKKIVVSTFLLLSSLTMANAQSSSSRPLSELINKEDSGWTLVQGCLKEASNKVEILPKQQQKAENALLQLQVTTRSPMGAIVYESGGILVDDGWIRILGSGSEKLDRSIMEWNRGKSYTNEGEQPSFLLVADDVLGGFFAINAGAFGQEEIGKVYYFSPDNLEWESLGLSYSDFISFCFAGDIDKFYEGLRWTNWREEVKKVDGKKGIHFFPFLWTAEGKDLNNVSRRAVPMQELWNLYMEQK